MHWAVTMKFRWYLYGAKFTVESDSSALKYLRSKKDLSPKLLRWALDLEEFDYEVRHRSGKKNANADFLSRYNSSKDLIETPPAAEKGNHPNTASVLQVAVIRLCRSKHCEKFTNCVTPSIGPS